MKVLNTMTLSFPSYSINEAFARSAIGAFAAQLDMTMGELGDIKTCVSEAVTNAVVHGYPDKVGVVTVRARVLEGSELEITVKDRGRGIEDVERAREPMFTTGGEDRSGMGFTIMESFMDSLRVRSKAGSGTTVTMRKRVMRKAVR